MILELCTDSIEGTAMARKYGARRVELCSAISVGGLTPGISLVEKCVAIGGIEVHAMLRHREGDFVYSDTDLDILLNEMQWLKRAGVSGVVFGCLSDVGDLDFPKSLKMVEQAKSLGLESTFHRAFDFVNDPFSALDKLIELGFKRVLTSGQKPTAIEGIELIEKLVARADGQIQIMAGSGVNSSNARQLAQIFVDALHFTSHIKNKIEFSGMGIHFLPDETKISGIKSAIGE